jgi:hypothetical protein
VSLSCDTSSYKRFRTVVGDRRCMAARWDGEAVVVPTRSRAVSRRWAGLEGSVCQRLRRKGGGGEVPWLLDA